MVTFNEQDWSLSNERRQPRHLSTVGREVSVRSAISVVGTPSAANSTIRTLAVTSQRSVDPRHSRVAFIGAPQPAATGSVRLCRKFVVHTHECGH